MFEKAKTDKYGPNGDNVETKNLIPIIREFLESIDAPFDPMHVAIEEIEWQSRDGFIAHGHNRGGMDLLAYTDIASLYGSGAPESISDYVQEQWDQTCNKIEKENPELTQEEVFDKAYEETSCEYSALAWRIRVMYEGENQLMVYVGWDKDAPYFRWNEKAQSEYQINFKDNDDLVKQLTQLALNINYKGK